MFRQNVEIPIDPQTTLKGELVVPDEATGLVIFAHGSGSSRLSPRNNQMADYLQQENFATLLFDLLTQKEDLYYSNRFDIDLLTERLFTTTFWIEKQDSVKDLPIGYFGAGTGAASALAPAAQLKDRVKAIVSRGGRPDLAMEFLPKVEAPTLLLVGGLDDAVIQLNKKALDHLKGEKSFKVISGATHLFEELGKLEKVSEWAAYWFHKHLISEKTANKVK